MSRFQFVADHRDAYETERLCEGHGESGGAYGSPRMTAELREKELRINERRIARVMRTFAAPGIRLRRGGGWRPRPAAAWRTRCSTPTPGPRTAPGLSPTSAAGSG